MAGRRTMRDDSRHGIATAVVFAEDLPQKAPNSCDRAKHSVPKLHAMLVEHIPDTGLGQDVRKGEPFIARPASKLVMEPPSR